MSKSRTPLHRLIGMARTRARRHYLAMILAERRDDWAASDRHHATLVNCERLETELVDIISLHRSVAPRHIAN